MENCPRKNQKTPEIFQKAAKAIEIFRVFLYNMGQKTQGGNRMITNDIRYVGVNDHEVDLFEIGRAHV